MCEACFRPTRRELLAGRARSSAWRAQVGVRLADDLVVLPRGAWAGDGRSPGYIVAEDDVRVLLVHHSASPNGYDHDEVPAILQGFWSFHTGPEKGWPDIAYNFLIDRFGTIWEGRDGSLLGQVRGDATGGNQGHSQLVCLIGTFETELPTPESRAALDRLLAWMADRAGLDPTPGARSRFVSLGSNRHPTGTEIDTPTITGHRTMSLTSCPGERFAPLVETEVAAGAADVHRAAYTPTTEPPATEPPTTDLPTTASPTSTSAADAGEAASPMTTSADSSPERSLLDGPVAAGLVVALGAVAGAVALRRRTEHEPD